MSAEKIKQFNDIIGSFLSQLSDTIGTTYYMYFENIIKYNSFMPMEQFLINILPIRDKIINRDEEFFSDKNKSEKKFSHDTEKMNAIFKLQDIYKTLDKESKENIWDIFQALLILGEEYIKLNQNKYI